MSIVSNIKGPEKSDQVLKQAKAGISDYLQQAKNKGRIDEQLYDVADKNTFPNLKKWLEDENIDAAVIIGAAGVSRNMAGWVFIPDSLSGAVDEWIEATEAEELEHIARFLMTLTMQRGKVTARKERRALPQTIACEFILIKSSLFLISEGL